MFIRSVTPSDAQALADIYAPYVLQTAITFETIPPDAAEFRARIAHISQIYPFLVAEENGHILGYAYASTFIARQAANPSAETSIYIDRKSRGQGLGRALYDALEDACRNQGLVNLLAAIAAPNGPSTIVDEASQNFHAHLGYKKVAHFDRVGYKMGEWIDLVWMQKRLSEEK